MEIVDYISDIYFDNIYDFSDVETVKKLREVNSHRENKKPRFSFMMTIYNNMDLLNSAINSIYKQNYEDWELVIWDNSDKNPLVWETIEKAMYADNRIHGYRNGQSLGWQKGASMCMKYITGEYTTFLAADDCLNLGVLNALDDVIDMENPDIIWIGNAMVTVDEHKKLAYIGGRTTDYKVYENDYRIDTIAQIMKTVYYNAFFHYMKVDFLRKNNIDFFEPYYGDCGGMTKAMAVAQKMVVTDFVGYFLTTNTSQTSGRYSWDSYEYIFANQWESVCELFGKEDFEKESENIKFIAERISVNLLSGIGCLCEGACRDKYMNPIEVNRDQIILQVENIINSDVILDMFSRCSNEIFEHFLSVISKLNYNFDDESLTTGAKNLLKYAGRIDSLSETDVKYLMNWLLDSKNKQCLGFDHLAKVIKLCSDSFLSNNIDIIKKILKKRESCIDKMK